MEIELVGAIDYKKLASFLDKRVGEIIKDNNLLNEYISMLEETNKITTQGSNELLNNIINYLENNSKGKIFALATKILNIGKSKQEKTLIDQIETIKDVLSCSGDNYKKLATTLKGIISDQIEALETKQEEIINEVKELEARRKVENVVAASKLPKYEGSIFEIFEAVEKEDLETNCKFASSVLETIRENQVTNNDCVVFKLKSISNLLEQIIIAEGFASFIVNQSNSSYYIPDFHDKDGNIIKDNKKAKQDYKKHMNYLYGKQSFFIGNGVNPEDARYCLPCCNTSDVMIGLETQALKDMIIKFTKTKYAKIQEVKEFGDKLYELAKETIPYIIPAIDAVKPDFEDPIRDYLKTKTNGVFEYENYTVLDKPKLVSHSDNVDETILISAIAHYTNLDYETAKEVYKEAVNNDPNFKETLMRLVFFKGNQKELEYITFEFQIGISLAALTNYARYNMHSITVPDFIPLVDIYQFVTPSSIKEDEKLKDRYIDVYTMNEINRNNMKSDYGIRDEDLVYYTLLGNKVNVFTRFCGKTFAQIGAPDSACNDSEVKDIVKYFHEEINKLPDAKVFSSLLETSREDKALRPEEKTSSEKALELRKATEEQKKS